MPCLQSEWARCEGAFHHRTHPAGLADGKKRRALSRRHSREQNGGVPITPTGSQPYRKISGGLISPGHVASALINTIRYTAGHKARISHSVITSYPACKCYMSIPRGLMFAARTHTYWSVGCTYCNTWTIFYIIL